MDIDPLQIVRTSKVFRRLPLDVLSKLTAVARVERFKNRTLLDHYGRRAGVADDR